jgi:hypothetical protein
MRNNKKTSVIYGRGYRSTFNMILSPGVGFLASHDRHRVQFGWRASEKRWRQQGGTGDGGGARVAASVRF